MYSLQLLDVNEQLISVIPRLVNPVLTRRLNDAWELSFAVTAEHLEHAPLDMGDRIILMAGETPLFKGTVTERDFSMSPWSFRAESTAAKLTELQTPGSWSYAGWKPEDALTDLLTGFSVVSQGSAIDWNGATLVNTEIRSFANDEMIMLAKHTDGSYFDEGSATLPVVDLGENCTRIYKVRWAQSIGTDQRLTVQVRMGNTPTPDATWTAWGAELEAAFSEEGAELAGYGYRYAQAKINLYTDDTSSTDPSGVPTGRSPIFQAVEFVGRYSGSITVGTMPTDSGKKLGDEMVFDYMNHLAAIVRICESQGWSFYVGTDDKMYVGADVGNDVSGTVIFREGKNATVTSYRENRANVENVITALGAGDGVGQLKAHYTHSASVEKYGERRGTYTNSDQADKTALLQEAQTYALRHAEPIVEVSLTAKTDDFSFMVGDTVSFVSELRGVSVTLPITEEERTNEGVKLGLNTTLQPLRDKLALLLRSRPTVIPGATTPPLAPVDVSATPGKEQILLRWSGQADYWIIETSEGESDYWTLLHPKWASQTYVHAAITPHVKRNYRVFAVSNNGLISEPSDVVNATAEPTYEPDTVPPEAPLNLQGARLLHNDGQGITVLAVALTWTENTEEDLKEYHLWRKDGPDPAEWQPVATIPKGAHTWIDQNGIRDRDAQGYPMTYYYRMHAADTAGNISAPSIEISVQTGLDTTGAEVPSTAPAVTIGKKMLGLRLTGSAALDVLQYRIQRRESPAEFNSDTGEYELPFEAWGAWEDAPGGITAALTWIDYSVSYDKAYQYRYRAIDRKMNEGTMWSDPSYAAIPSRIGAQDAVFRWIQAEHYAEIRNNLPYTGLDSLDDTHPIEFDFYLPEETTNIAAIFLSAKGLRYRAYSETAAEGADIAKTSGIAEFQGVPNTDLAGDHTHLKGTFKTVYEPDHDHKTGEASAITFGDPDTTSSDGDHSHNVGGSTDYSGEPITGYTSTDGDHSHTIPGHQHAVPVDIMGDAGGHEHALTGELARGGTHKHAIENMAHTHQVIIPGHVHPLLYGIHEDTTPASVKLYYDNGAGYCTEAQAITLAVAPDENSPYDLIYSLPVEHKYAGHASELNLTDKFTGVGWKRIKFVSSRRGRINWNLIVKVDLTA